MNSTSQREQHFKAIVKTNPKSTKVLFYLTSYGFPWWVYSIPIFRYKKLGYEVVVYDLHDKIVENDDPKVLPDTTAKLISDISRRKKEYEDKGINTFHGIGNSLGSYLIFNYSLHFPIDAIALNGGGSIADVIFHGKSGSWKKIATAYREKGYDHHKLSKLWTSIDSPTLGKNIQAKKILVMYSLRDGTIPLSSSEEFVRGLKASGKQVVTKTDNKPHVVSVMINSFRIRLQYDFLNKNTISR